MGDTACLTSENAPPIWRLGREGGSAGRRLSDRRLKALAPFLLAPSVLFPKRGSPDSQPFLRDEPFLWGTLRTLLCPRHPVSSRGRASLHARFLPLCWGGRFLSAGTSARGKSPHLLRGCFVQPLFLFLFFFLLTRLLFTCWASQMYSLSLVAEVSLPACTPGFPLWISFLLCSQPPGTLWHRRKSSPFSPRTRPLLA